MFFFSSRRRHTRWPRDWSSDVCSSDLKLSELIKFRLIKTIPLPCRSCRHNPRPNALLAVNVQAYCPSVREGCTRFGAMRPSARCYRGAVTEAAPALAKPTGHPPLHHYIITSLHHYIIDTGYANSGVLVPLSIQQIFPVHFQYTIAYTAHQFVGVKLGEKLVRAHLVHHSFIEHTAERTVQQDVKVFQGVVMANLCGKGIPIQFRHISIRNDYNHFLARSFALLQHGQQIIEPLPAIFLKRRTHTYGFHEPLYLLACNTGIVHNEHMLGD